MAFPCDELLTCTRCNPAFAPRQLGQSAAGTECSSPATQGTGQALPQTGGMDVERVLMTLEAGRRCTFPAAAWSVRQASVLLFRLLPYFVSRKLMGHLATAAKEMYICKVHCHLIFLKNPQTNSWQANEDQAICWGNFNPGFYSLTAQMERMEGDFKHSETEAGVVTADDAARKPVGDCGLTRSWY